MRVLLQGLAYTGYASVLWPAVPLVVEERMVGLAFGIVMSTLNLVKDISNVDAICACIIIVALLMLGLRGHPPDHCGDIQRIG